MCVCVCVCVCWTYYIRYLLIFLLLDYIFLAVCSLQAIASFIIFIEGVIVIYATSVSHCA